METVRVKPALRPEECAVTHTLGLVGSKWTPLLIWHLHDGPKRYGELLRLLPGISPKTLADRLHVLEQERLLSRAVYPDKPPRVEYTLTDRGRSLGDILDAIGAWTAG